MLVASADGAIKARDADHGDVTCTALRRTESETRVIGKLGKPHAAGSTVS
jgi:hypothetical protein